jgi:hypothetical protein
MRQNSSVPNGHAASIFTVKTEVAWSSEASQPRRPWLNSFWHRLFLWVMLSSNAISSVLVLPLFRILWSISCSTWTFVTDDSRPQDTSAKLIRPPLNRSTHLPVTNSYRHTKSLLFLNFTSFHIFWPRKSDHGSLSLLVHFIKWRATLNLPQYYLSLFKRHSSLLQCVGYSCVTRFVKQ